VGVADIQIFDAIPQFGDFRNTTFTAKWIQAYINQIPSNLIATPPPFS
jgi:hypothetical protein